MASREPATHGLGSNGNSGQAPSRRGIHVLLAAWAYHTNFVWSRATGQPLPPTPEIPSLTIESGNASLELFNEWMDDLRNRLGSISPIPTPPVQPIPPTEALQVQTSDLPDHPVQRVVDSSYTDELTNEQLADDIYRYYVVDDAVLDESSADANANVGLEGFAPSANDLPDAAHRNAPCAADDVSWTGAWSDGGLVQDTAATHEDRQMQASMAQHYQTDNTSAVEQAQTSVQPTSDYNQQFPSYNHTPPFEYTPSIAHALVDDTQQNVDHTFSAPLKEAPHENTPLSDFAISQWGDIAIPSLLPSLNSTTSLAYSTPEAAYQYAAHASIEQSPFRYASQVPTPQETPLKVGSPAETNRLEPRTCSQTMQPPTPIANEKRVKKRKRSESKEGNDTPASFPSGTTPGPLRKRRNLSVDSPLKYHSPSPFNMTIHSRSPDDITFMFPTPSSERYEPEVGEPGPSGIKSEASATRGVTIDATPLPGQSYVPSRKGKERAHATSFQPYPSAPRVRTYPLPVVQNESPGLWFGEGTSPTAYYESPASFASSPGNMSIAGPSPYPIRPAASRRLGDQSRETSAIPTAVLNTSTPGQVSARRKLFNCPLQDCGRIIMNTREQITQHVMNHCQAEVVGKARTTEAKETGAFNPEIPGPKTKTSIKCDECQTRSVESLDSWVKHLIEKHSRTQKCKRCDRTFDSYKEMRKHSDGHGRVRKSADSHTPALGLELGSPGGENGGNKGGGRPLADWQVEGYSRL